MDLKFSKHARERMILRGISVLEVFDGIKMGAKELQGDRIVAHYRYFSVVYKKTGNCLFIITVKPR